MRKSKITIVMLVLLTILVVQPAFSAPYRPPPPGPNDAPIPPPADIGPGDTSKKYPLFPSPTPCIPNFCSFKQTTCCFSPLCVFHGETDKGGNSRCLFTLNKVKTNSVSQIKQSAQSFFGKIISAISSVFGN